MYKCENCEAPMTTIEHEHCRTCDFCIDGQYIDELNELTSNLLTSIIKTF